jgi:2,3-diketo-5-methylthio-1-phosphopentane phosphatase
MTFPSPTLFLDFDGTVTTRDATDAILEAYADREWLRVEDAWKAGRIGSRECLTAQMALVNARPEAIDALLDDIEIDPGFAPLVAWCSDRDVRVHIVSDGFDYCIRRILERPSLDLTRHLRRTCIVSSSLRCEGARWRASFTPADRSCVHGCATCKPAAIERLRVPGGLTVFAGDGLSDRYAAAVADLVFAKQQLASYCDDRSIPYTPFDTLDAVVRALESLVTSDAERLKALTGKASPLA